MVIVTDNNKIKTTDALEAAKEVRDFSQRDLMHEYIKGAVYQLIKEREKENKISFTIRDLLGQSNRVWTDTPMQFLYNYYKKNNSEERAREKAANDAGWVLKDALERDKRFDFDNSEKDWFAVRYTLIKE